MCAGHNTAAVVWLSVGQSRREMYAVSHLLLGGAVRGRHGRLWPEDQQRELDEMSADVKGDVRRPEQQAERLLSVGGRVSSLHGVDETQWWRYSQVVMMITASVSEKMWKLSHCRNSAKNLLHDTKISLKSGNRLLSYGQKTIFNMAAFRYLEFLTNFTFGHVTHRVPNLLLCTKVRQNRVILCLDMAINDFQDVVYSPSWIFEI